MSTVIRTCGDLESWAEQMEKQKECVFRGQGNAQWPLRTSLARHFLGSQIPVDPHEWRHRELKMYQMFRQRLIRTCPSCYDDWKPVQILSLMQHHGVPTRLLDFTRSPLIAAFFALEEAQGDSAVFIVNEEQLSEDSCGGTLPPHLGPTHDPHYKRAEKYEGAVVVAPRLSHSRIAAQQGCFLLPGHISETISEDLIHEVVTLSESVIYDALIHLRGRGIERPLLFPDLDGLAREVKRSSTVGSPHYLGG